jgi:hypothetical protein
LTFHQLEAPECYGPTKHEDNAVNIRDVADISQLPAKTIRYYEEIDLIRPSRARNGYRCYTLRDAQILIFISRARSLGFTIHAQQTLADVHHALRRFVEAVAQRHDGKPPVLYGNCQADWAVTLLSADCVGLVGPAVLNGSPLSYWAGESGVNPIRITGGLLGGAWLTHFVSDLGDGRFDGAWLAQNFENLKPEKSIWEKYAGLFNRIDTERERFVEFERWWNGF